MCEPVNCPKHKPLELCSFSLMFEKEYSFQMAICWVILGMQEKHLFIQDARVLDRNRCFPLLARHV